MRCKPWLSTGPKTLARGFLTVREVSHQIERTLKQPHAEATIERIKYPAPICQLCKRAFITKSTAPVKSSDDCSSSLHLAAISGVQIKGNYSKRLHLRNNIQGASTASGLQESGKLFF
ncbi:uncharacterized protein [Chlorocebus sabaeus]|uniref:uncharacterized protein n=1 Tax=Chlorocebus sabaeus TaxID=60711 RepID=UPI003BF96837